jgi:hypothetical protein
MGLSADRGAVEAGRPVVKVLRWGGPSEVYLFGAVHVDGALENYLRAARDVQRLRGAPGYLGIAELPEEPTVADLEALAFEPDDVKALKSCREGACDAAADRVDQAFHDGVDFARTKAVEQANDLGRWMILQLLRSYRRVGTYAREYRDKQNRPASANSSKRWSAAHRCCRM